MERTLSGDNLNGWHMKATIVDEENVLHVKTKNKRYSYSIWWQREREYMLRVDNKFNHFIYVFFRYVYGKT